VTSPKLAAVLLLLPLLLAGCGNSSGGDGSAKPAEKGQCSYTATGDAARKVDPPPSNPESGAPTKVTIQTDRGDIPVALDPDKAPCTVNSFLSLAKQGFFDNTLCHRLVTGGLNVLQCGDPSGTGAGGPGYEFKDELLDQDPRLQPCTGQVDPQTNKQVCTYSAGTVAMANAGPDTNGSQFFLVYADSPLPAAYTVFGRMSAAGLKVVQEVAKHGNAADGVAPKESVTIKSVG
jgi:peptidyl-prolyl cis-trans isomerase B (cyclophilin B)